MWPRRLLVVQENDFVNFMRDPLSPSPAPPTASPPSRPEDDWADVAGKEFIAILTRDNFDAFITSQGSVLVMFYAPCKGFSVCVCVCVCVCVFVFVNERERERERESLCNNLCTM